MIAHADNSHLARRDDWAKLFQELVRVPFFFHPLVSWLLARLDRERELLCDESVIRLGEDPTTYARLLLELARRPGRCVPKSPSLRPGWLPFLDRRTVSIRILTLLEDPMPNADSTSGRHRFALLATLFLLGSLALGSLRLKATEPRTAEDHVRDPESQASPKPASSQKENPVLRGAIRDAEDRPIADATVVIGLEGPDQSRRSILKADREGRFSWNAPPGDGTICIVYAHKEGWGWGSSSVWLGAPQPLRELPIRLGKSEPFRGRLVDDATWTVTQVTNPSYWGHHSPIS